MRMNFPQELHHVGRACVVVKQFIVQTEPTCPRSAGNRRQGGDSIVPVPCVLDGRFSPGGPDSPPQRLQQIATFIEKNDASLPFEALFLAAASRRGSSGQWLARLVREPAALASVDSIRVCIAAAVYTPNGNERQKDARSCLPREGRSSLTGRTPMTEFLAPMRQPTYAVAVSTVSVLGLGEVFAAGSRVARLVSSDVPTTRCTRPSQPLPSTSFPARTVGLRSSDGLRALRDFLMVSCPYRSEHLEIFHYLGQTV